MTKKIDKAAARMAQIGIDYDVDDAYWTQAKINVNRRIKESKADNFAAWYRPFYGASYFAIGFFMMLTSAEIYPFMINWVGYLMLALIGGIGMGWGLYTMAS